MALQMICGKPKVVFKFRNGSLDKGKRLICDIKNIPIKSKFLKIIGVSRRSTQISCWMSIFETNTKHEIVRHGKTNINFSTEGNHSLKELHAASGIKCIPVFTMVRNGEFVALINQGEEIPKINDGYYTFLLDVRCDGETDFSVNHEFYVSAVKNELFWID